LSRGTDHQEIEWQYEVPYDLEKVEEWLGSHGPRRFELIVLSGSFKELTDTYYDTEDWRLYRAGYALRVRRDASGKGAEATMKSPISGAAGNLHRWREISEPLKSDDVDALLRAPGPVGVRLRTLVGPCNMHRIFEVHTRRQTFDLLLAGQPADLEKAQTGRSADAIRVGEVALDDSEIPLGEGSARLTRVEVEVDASVATASSTLEGFVKVMEGDLGLRPSAISKYEAGLSATAQNPDGEPRGGGRYKGTKKE
jgi:inorganic triphosphatase YgiF